MLRYAENVNPRNYNPQPTPNSHALTFVFFSLFLSSFSRTPHSPSFALSIMYITPFCHNFPTAVVLLSSLYLRRDAPQRTFTHSHSLSSRSFPSFLLDSCLQCTVAKLYTRSGPSLILVTTAMWQPTQLSFSLPQSLFPRPISLAEHVHKQTFWCINLIPNKHPNEILHLRSTTCCQVSSELEVNVYLPSGLYLQLGF